MSVYAGPNFTEDGMYLCIDAGNSKSYDGTNIIKDLSKTSDGTLFNNPTHSLTNGGYLNFDGISQYLAISNNNFPLNDTDKFSVECVFRIPYSATWSNGTNYGSIFTRGDYGGSHGLIRTTNDNQIGMWVRGNSSGLGFAAATITRNEWYHCIGTWNGSNTIRLYINGKLFSSVPDSISGGFEQSPWYIGSIRAMSGSQGNRFEGDIALARLYNRELNANEIQQNFNALRGRFGL